MGGSIDREVPQGRPVPALGVRQAVAAPAPGGFCEIEFTGVGKSIYN